MFTYLNNRLWLYVLNPFDIWKACLFLIVKSKWSQIILFLQKVMFMFYIYILPKILLYCSSLEYPSIIPSIKSSYGEILFNSLLENFFKMFKQFWFPKKILNLSFVTGTSRYLVSNLLSRLIYFGSSVFGQVCRDKSLIPFLYS